MRAARGILLLLGLLASAAEARAELMAVPFFGVTFQGQTALPLFGVQSVESTELSRSIVLGASAVWLTGGVIGAEAELAHSPRFFERSSELSVPSSAVPIFDLGNTTTVSGHLILAAPLSLTRDSLRPYVVGGLGVVHVGVADAASIATVDRNLLAVTLGGGAFGRLSRRTGLRFDLRHTRSVRDDQVSTALLFGTQTRVRLSYWRATVGVTISSGRR